MISLSFQAFSKKIPSPNHRAASLLTSRLLLHLPLTLLLEPFLFCGLDPTARPAISSPIPRSSTGRDVPGGLDLCALLPPPTPPPPLSVDTSLKSCDNNDGVAVHGQLELKSLFDYGAVDHRRCHDPVTVDRQIMPLLDLNDLGSLNEKLGEEFSSGGMSSKRQSGHEPDDGGDDRSRREVVIDLPHQQPKPTSGKKKRERMRMLRLTRSPWSSKASGLLKNTG
ncbi:hypothetical protein NL676_015046 [Syzygium grande]|nr:hypothetical protein NL676_015046 [Syzygium grande]